MHKRDFPHHDLRDWFEGEKRVFPWRLNPSPYRVWVSEVMLQQTRASVVVPYFERFLRRFPTISSLARAKEEEVIKMWEGLGYYVRARALHQGAQCVVERYEGRLPDKEEELRKIKGLGPYTVGAILSFAFHRRSPAVDGNVKRVVSRFFALKEEIDRPKVERLIKEKVREILPEKEPWIIMEALIELGATLCTRNPNCTICPLKEGCRAFALGKTLDLPKKKGRPAVTVLRRHVLVVCFGQEVLVEKKEGKQVMSGLYEFPYFSSEQEAIAFYPNLNEWFDLEPTCHTFTRYKAHLYPIVALSLSKQEIAGCRWVSVEEIEELPFSSGHRKVLKRVMEGYADFTH